MSENLHYTPATNEPEARRWSALAPRDKSSLSAWIADDVRIIADLTSVLRTPHSSLDPRSRMTIERMRAKYEREAEYLQAVLDGKESPNGRILRRF